MTAILGLAAILAAEDLKSTEVDCPEWGGAVRLRMMTAEARDQLGAKIYDLEVGQARGAITKREVLKASLVDGLGAPLIATDDDYAALLQKAPAVIDRLFLAALDLNGMSAKAGEQLKND